jgi:hypothetical protein
MVGPTGRLSHLLDESGTRQDGTDGGRSGIGIGIVSPRMDKVVDYSGEKRCNENRQDMGILPLAPEGESCGS